MIMKLVCVYTHGILNISNRYSYKKTAIDASSPEIAEKHLMVKMK
jgi:hypothetical protein